MRKEEIETIIRDWKASGKPPLRLYTPFKYFKGLSSKQEVLCRLKEIARGSKSAMDDPSSYRPFSTDLGKTTRPSNTTKAFERTYGPYATSLKAKAEVTKIPLDILQRVFDKGRAAWRTGHRPGATPEQWGYARVHSFIMLGCTCFGPDLSLFREAIGRMSSQDKKKWLCKPVLCPRSTLGRRYFRTRGGITFLEETKTSLDCDSYG